MKDAMVTRWDALKLIALLLMFVDHAGAFFATDEQWLRAVGRACAPLFLFAVGFAPHYKFNVKLLVLAVILSGFDWWINGAPNTLNILFTIIFIRLLLAYLEARGRVKLRLHEWVIGAAALTPTVLITQYGSLGMLFALSAFIFKHRTFYDIKTPERFLLAVTLLYAVLVSLLSEFTLSASVITLVSLMLMYQLILWFLREPKGVVALPSSLQYVSHYTAEIYVVHLIVLIGFTGHAL